jgi:hypothetical protein
VGSNPTLSANSFLLWRLNLSHTVETPFDSIENAHEYVRMLMEAVTDAKREVEADINAGANEPSAERRLEAQRLVQYKLERLEQHLKNSSRVLNDLRSLRRLLFEERADLAPGVTKPTST